MTISSLKEMRVQCHRLTGIMPFLARCISLRSDISTYSLCYQPAGLKKISHHEKKLKSELPQIMSLHGRTLSACANARLDGEKRPWLTRTDFSEALMPASGKSWKLSKSHLRPEMSCVLDEGIRLAVIALQVGKYDINMDDINYTIWSSRSPSASILQYRLSVKAAVLQTIPMVLKFSTIGDEAIRQLLKLSNFIYPRTDQGGFNRAKPYSGNGFREVIKAVFYTSQQYHDAGLKNMHLLHSMYDWAPDETEIPPTMLALAATASFSRNSYARDAGGRHQQRSRIDWDSIVKPSDSEPTMSSNKPT
ncbi:hypothetical protein LXA43DRAFT_1066358 [Ganoderma leucocontextum]|nr:hypothetical protein LXA43DRAFT_1066358 [Ganoderma leucocontextum]